MLFIIFYGGLPISILNVDTHEIKQLQKKEDVTGLTEALNDNDSYIRFKAAEALGKIEDHAAVDGLLSALDDKDQSVKEMAIIALGGLGNKKAVLPLIANFGNDKQLKELMVFSLGEIGGKDSLDYLILALDDDDEDIRIRAAEALGKISNPDSVEALITSLGHNNTEFKIYAISALGEIGDDKAIKPLLKYLKTDKWIIRKCSLNALAKIDECSIEPFIKALYDEDWHVREKAVELVGKLGDDNCLPYINLLYKDPDEDVRQRAIGVVEKREIIKKEISQENEVKLNKQKIEEVIDKIGKEESLKILFEYLNNEDPDIRVRAVQVLAKIKDEKAVKPLINSLRDKDHFVIEKTKDSLIEMGKLSVLPLIKVLNNNYGADFKKRVVDVLGMISDERAVYPLIQNLADENDNVQQEIVIALVKFRKRAIGPLIDSLNHDNSLIREKSAEILGEINDPSALDPLEDVLLDDNSKVRNGARIAINRIKKNSVMSLR